MGWSRPPANTGDEGRRLRVCVRPSSQGQNGDVIAGGIKTHTRQTMKNVAHALALAGCTLEDVVKTTVWLVFGSFLSASTGSAIRLTRTAHAGCCGTLGVVMHCV